MKAAPHDVQETTTDITNLFKGFPTRLGDRRKDRDWTVQLKDDIGSLGAANGWSICTSGFKDRGFDCEWLYDLIWYRNTHPDNYLAEVYLVLESEWNTSPTAIKYDFEKLLLAKSTIKVMVFQAWQENIADVFSLLQRGISAFGKRSVGEIYLLAGFNLNSYSFDVRQIDGGMEQ
jgi:hypothetical protein